MPAARKPFASAETRPAASAHVTSRQAPSSRTRNAARVRPASTPRCQSSPIVERAAPAWGFFSATCDMRKPYGVGDRSERLVSRARRWLDRRMNTTAANAVLGDGRAVPPHDEFYRELTTRNTPLITPEEQERIRTATILIAGCGSIGGAAVEPLIRLGAENLILAEPDGYDIANMNRQSCRLQDVGRNKAAVFVERMREINPYAKVELHEHGITAENVDDVTTRADLILDGIDVTTKPPLRHKVHLHQHARDKRKVVVSGYDIAGVQMLLIYDYAAGEDLLGGKV